MQRDALLYTIVYKRHTRVVWPGDTVARCDTRTRRFSRVEWVSVGWW